MTTTPSITGTRNLSIDLVKIVAMCLVVALHTTYGFIKENSFEDVSFIIYNLGVIAIPLFFMVSGYLLLGREDISFRYSLKKIYGIIKFSFLMIFGFWFLWSIKFGFDIRTLIGNITGCFFQRGTFYMFWYFGAMCLIYIMLPFFNKLYFRRRIFMIVCLGCILIQNIAFTSNIISDGETSVCQTFRLWNWFTYFFLGGVLKHQTLNKRFLAWSILPLLILTLSYMIWLYPFFVSQQCEYFYSSFIVEIMCCTIFLFIKSINIRHSRIIKNLSALFLPVYTFHVFVIALSSPISKALYDYQIGGVIYWIVVLCITMVISWFLMKIPQINKMFKI